MFVNRIINIMFVIWWYKMSIEKEVFFAKPLYLVGFNKKKPLEWEAFSDPAGIHYKTSKRLV